MGRKHKATTEAPSDAYKANHAQRMHSRRCPGCGRLYGDDSDDTPTQVTLDTSREPLVALSRLHDHFVDQDGKPNTRDALLDLCDNAQKEPPPKFEDLQRTMRYFWATPDLRPTASLLEARWEYHRSDRDIARRLDRDHKTVGDMLKHAIHLFKEALMADKVA